MNIMQTVMTQPGINVNIGPERLSAVSPGAFGLQMDASLGSSWVRAADAYAHGGISPKESSTTEFQSNQAITYSMTIYPYGDQTHEYIQPGMVAFVSRHVDNKYKLYNMAPVFKMNILQLEAHMAVRSSTSTEAVLFRRLLEQYGEPTLEAYHKSLISGNPPNSADLKQLYTLAQKPEFRYLTKLGIQLNWNFAGIVLSKGESTGPATFLDHHASTDMMHVVGLVVGERSRATNIWGRVSPGDQLFLVLRRAEVDGPLQWIPYHDRQREYPARSISTYLDKKSRICNSLVQYIGLATEAVERDTTNNEVDSALGLFSNNIKDAYSAHGPLSNIILQVRI